MKTTTIILALLLIACPLWAGGQDGDGDQDPGHQDFIFGDGFETGDPSAWDIEDCEPDMPPPDQDGCVGFYVFVGPEFCFQVICVNHPPILEPGACENLDLIDGAGGEFELICADGEAR